MRVVTRCRSPAVSAGVLGNSNVGLTVTDPLQLYRSYLARGIINPDPAQHRAAIVVKSVYDRLLDYTPPDNFANRLEVLTNTLRSIDQRRGDGSRLSNVSNGLPKTWRDNSFLPSKMQSPRLQEKSLVKTMSDEEALLNLDTPQGLLLYGEVGSGKSMLMDMLASSMPFASKQRHHFNAFMLSVYAELEIHRKSSALQDTFSLLHVAQELISKSTILFLDEFQFPDRATSMILRHLLSYFFQLGGVLVATSNRLPEDLLASDWRKGEFGIFEEVLRRRCEVWDMGSCIDWRRREEVGKMVSVPAIGPSGNNTPTIREVLIPSKYFIQSGTAIAEFEWDKAVQQASAGKEQKWQSSELLVYSRRLPVPKHRNGAAMFSFHDLCILTLGPADYITLTSAYSILIIHSVPVLTAKSHRHEARRFITLLDAIYETKCKLIIQAAAPIEELFFPDADDEAPSSSGSIDSEAFSESYQDLVDPFRPNVSIYDATLDEMDEEFRTSVTSGALKFRSVLADEDNDFNGKYKGEKADFTFVGKYHGEDEKFAFKRAISRLWEVCGEKWWKIDTDLDIDLAAIKAHTPLPQNLRFWEHAAVALPSAVTVVKSKTDEMQSHEGVGFSQEINGAPEIAGLFKHGSSPYRVHDQAPPRFPPQHMWGVTKWGKGAGKWGQGAEAFKEESEEKEEAKITRKRHDLGHDEIKPST